MTETPAPETRPFDSAESCVWRNSDLLVMRRSAKLPPYCVKSNEPAAGWVTMQVHSLHPLILLLGMPVFIFLALAAFAQGDAWGAGLLLVGAIGILLLQRCAKIEIGLSEAWLARRRKAITTFRLLFLLGIALVGASTAYICLASVNFVTAWSLAAGASLFVVGMAWGVCGPRLLTVARSDGVFLWLKGANPAFLERLPEVPGTRNGAGPTQKSSRRGRDIASDLRVSFEKASSGGEVQFAVQRQSGKTETILLKIPPNMKDGQRFRLHGLGDPGYGGAKAGDLILTAHIVPNSVVSDGKNDDPWIEDCLRQLAERAWPGRKTAPSEAFALRTEDLPDPITSEAMSLVLQRMYVHARTWAPGFEVPFYVPKVNLCAYIEAAGQFRTDSEGYPLIDVGSQFVGHHPAVLAILAHEACHHILELSGIRRENTEENERFTDLAIFVCGFGAILLNGYSLVRKVDAGWAAAHLGYLSPEQYRRAQDWVLRNQP